MLHASSNSFLAARLANLVGADPFSLDRPGPGTLMVDVVPSKVAVLDQSTAGVAAVEVDDLVL